MLNSGLAYSVNSMSTQAKRLDAITYNLANSNTIGFKRRMTAAVAEETGTKGQVLNVTTLTRTDFGQGPIKHTGNRFDLALDGEGWFPVEGPNGEMFTRRGDFRIGDAGVLQTQEGYPLAWKTAPGRLEAAGTAITISKNGQVFQDGGAVGQLEIVAFPAQDQLKPLNGGYWKADARLKRETSDAQVHQFAVEGSNTTSVDQLVEMIGVQRHYESSARMLTMIDRSYQRLNRQ
ncbi:MAG: flagellar basal-body rod protein FlgF [Planctomycetota bacterium]|jgi:flagellar basal-body rod protein FlgF